MADPVDQASFADLVQRFSALVDQWRGIVSRVLLQSLTGPGPWSLSAAEHGGKTLLVGNGATATSITLTLPADAPAGTLFLLDQDATAPLRLVPAAGATLQHRLNHNGTAGTAASVMVKCIRNADGASAAWRLAGDSAVVG